MGMRLSGGYPNTDLYGDEALLGEANTDLYGDETLWKEGQY